MHIATPSRTRQSSGLVQLRRYQRPGIAVRSFAGGRRAAWSSEDALLAGTSRPVAATFAAGACWHGAWAGISMWRPRNRRASTACTPAPMQQPIRCPRRSRVARSGASTRSPRRSPRSRGWVADWRGAVRRKLAVRFTPCRHAQRVTRRQRILWNPLHAGSARASVYR